jgi:hypothetical protein
MERGSNKHGPNVDDELKHEVEGLVRGAHSTHAEEWADPEAPGDDQPDADRYPAGELLGGIPDGLTADEVELRSAVAAALRRSDFPAGREELLEKTVERYAPPRVLEELRRLPGDRTFDNLGELWTALGHGTEEHRF